MRSQLLGRGVGKGVHAGFLPCHAGLLLTGLVIKEVRDMVRRRRRSESDALGGTVGGEPSAAAGASLLTAGDTVATDAFSFLPPGVPSGAAGATPPLLFAKVVACAATCLLLPLKALVLLCRVIACLVCPLCAARTIDNETGGLVRE